MGAPPVVMFLSTGRCGTQWLTAAIAELYPDVAVEHEPIGPLYAPRRYFRRYEDPAAILEVPEVAAHLARIERSDRPYVETGWPLSAALPLLAERLPERLRVVHLTRPPVPTALSHLAHSSYAGSARDDAYTRLATLGPTDRGVFQPDYAQAWDGLSPYEKCLFWWTEVGMLGLEFPGRVDWIPFHRVQSERILGGERDELEQLLAFMEMPWDDGWLARRAPARLTAGTTTPIRTSTRSRSTATRGRPRWRSGSAMTSASSTSARSWRATAANRIPVSIASVATRRLDRVGRDA